MAELEAKIYINGRVVGSVKDGRSFAQEVRKNRRQGILSGEVNVSYAKKRNEVHILTDRGRARKPYLVIEDGKSKCTEELKKKLHVISIIGG